MGRKALKIDIINNLATREICSNNRKKGLMKKAIELSKLCDHKVFLYIYDD